MNHSVGKTVLAMGFLLAESLMGLVNSGQPLAAAQGISATAGNEADYVSQLRRQGLYRLASAQAEAVLQNVVTEGERVSIAIELVRTWRDWSLSSRPEQRAQRWKTLTQKVEHAEGLLANNPRILLLQVEWALAKLTRSELLQSELVPADSEATGAVHAAVRSAIQSLRQTSERAELLLREQRLNGSSSEDSSISVYELEVLQSRLQLLLGRAYAAQGETYPAKSAERLAALDQAVTLVAQAESSHVDDIRWKARLLRLRVLRLFGRYAEAAQRLAEYHASQPSQRLLPLLAAEQLRLAIGEEDFTEATRIRDSVEAQSLPQEPSWELAKLELLTAQWRAESGRSDSAMEAFSQEAAKSVQYMRQQYGPVWARRAESVVAGVLMQEQGQSVGVATAKMRAEMLFHARRLDEAIQAYDQAEQQAAEQGKMELAREMAITAAAIAQTQEKYGRAAQRYFRVVEKGDSTPEEAVAHHAGIVCLAAAIPQSTDEEQRANRLQEYRDRLTRHLDHWPADATTPEIRLWSGDWYYARGEFAQAVGEYQQIPPANEQYSQAVEKSLATYLAMFPLEESLQVREELAHAARRHLQPVITGANNAWPDRWTPLQRQAAMVLAKLSVSQPPDGATYCLQLLSAALNAGGDTPPEWQAEAWTGVGVAQALVGRVEDCEDSFGRALQFAPALATDWIVRAGRALDSLPPVEAAKAARALRGVAGQASSPNGTATEVDALATARANILALAGDRRSALAILKELIDGQTAQRDVYRQYAQLLAASGQRDDILHAAAIYARMEKRSKPGNENWFDARIDRIQAYLQAGESAKAANLFKLTKTIYKSPQTSALQSKWRELEQSLQGEPTKTAE